VSSPRPIPIIDLKAQFATIRQELEDAVGRVLASGGYIGGAEVAEFEREFAAFCGASHACAVGNGTDALQLALRAYGVSPGDEVITVSNTFIATGEAILLAGARPVFVDVDETTHTMDPARVEQAITPLTRAIVPVHLYGHPADMDAIGEIAARHRIPVLEDAAQAHGALWRGRRAGSLGHAACFSFYPTKNLGACGDAGMVTSSDAAFVARVRQIANHGAGSHRYDNVVLGTNSRLDALQAAILRVKLRHLERWNAERSGIAALYSQALQDVPGVSLPVEREAARSSWHLYTIRAADRDALAAHLQSRSIGTAVHYPRPIHLQPAMAAAGGTRTALPVSERLAREVLCLPLYAELSREDAQRVAAEVRAFCTAGVGRN
jgi:dTDP-4-amino-4,6-dideoxygalactose transaminase